jgi:hypothetical protein
LYEIRASGINQQDMSSTTVTQAGGCFSTRELRNRKKYGNSGGLVFVTKGNRKLRYVLTPQTAAA